MKKLLNIVLLCLALSSWPVFAQTEQKVQFADCTSSGCTCSVTNLSLTEVAATVPITIPDGANNMILVRKPDGALGWSGRTPAQIDSDFGGSGSCPLQLFDEFVPRDGTWSITEVATDLSRCPMVAMAGMEGMGGLDSTSASVNWGGRFHPEKLFPAMAGMVDWRQTGRLSWRGIVVDEKVEGASARVTFTARLISPTVVRGESRFAFNMPGLTGVNPAIFQIGGGCRSVTTYVARWHG